MDVKKILEQAVKMDASDIFFVAGSPYAFKIKKEIIKWFYSDERKSSVIR